MRRTTSCLLLFVLVGLGWDRQAPQAQSAAPPLVGTWLLTSEQLIVDGAPPVTAQGAKGMLVFDRKGHYFELVDRPVPAALAKGLSDGQLGFYRYGGTWGRYNAARDTGRISFESFAGRSPNLTGAKFGRTFTITSVPDEQDRLITTSQAGELHTLGISTRTWQRVPDMAGIPQAMRGVFGFWRHDVEGQKAPDSGQVLTEVRRDPSVIVYTPAGFVGVHFPTRNRMPFAAAEPTEAEARQGNYLGYFATLGLYPGGRHQGLIFHNILGGSLTPGSTLRRFFDLRGDTVDLTFPAGTNRQGVRTQTYVKLQRLSGLDDMTVR
jgi:hypothetical protein